MEIVYQFLVSWLFLFTLGTAKLGFCASCLNWQENAELIIVILKPLENSSKFS